MRRKNADTIRETLVLPVAAAEEEAALTPCEAKRELIEAPKSNEDNVIGGDDRKPTTMVAMTMISRIKWISNGSATDVVDQSIETKSVSWSSAAGSAGSDAEQDLRRRFRNWPATARLTVGNGRRHAANGCKDDSDLFAALRLTAATTVH